MGGDSNSVPTPLLIDRGGLHARVYPYVLTIEPSHTLLLIDRNANYGITTGNHQKYEKPYGNHFVWTGRGW